MAWIWKFKVTGDRAFPLDMLRYDCCYPRTSKCVEEIHASFDMSDRTQRRLAMKPFEVELISHNGTPELTRWTSFGWKVFDVRKERP
jgi:hypothetical protein